MKVKLETRTVDIRGNKFTVKQLTWGQLRPFVNELSEGGENALLTACVTMEDGSPLGNPDDLPGDIPVKLIAAAVEVNHLGDSAEGNA